jgi:PEGA domain
MSGCVFVDSKEKYAHARNSMFRITAFCLGVCLSASAVARADSSADQKPILTDAEKETRLRFLVKTGDQARLAGRYDEAATAYTLALEIHSDRVISGRRGLALMKLGQLDRAGDDLYLAVVGGQGQGVTTKERNEVTAAYDKAKALTAWVNIDISHAGAKVTCDGVPTNPKGFATFWRFMKPGEHTVHVQLDGYEEASQTFTAMAGEETTISFKLVPLAGAMLPELPAPVAVTLPDNRLFPPMLRASNVAGDPNYDPHEDPSYGEPKETKPAKKKSGPRFSINGGVVTVFGVASWNPAVGPVLGVGLRPNDYFSLGLEGRAAWLTTGVADSSISAMTAGGLLSACAHLKWFFGCGLGHLGVTNVEFAKESYIEKKYSVFVPGVGGRIGANVHLGQSASILVSADVLGFQRGVKVVVDRTVIADQPPIMAGVQVGGGWEW